MKTNFTTDKALILTDEDNNIMGIIKCEAGEMDITDKLIKAISEHTFGTPSILEPKTLVDSFGEHHFEVKVIEEQFEDDEDESSYLEWFTLTQTAIY